MKKYLKIIMIGMVSLFLVGCMDSKINMGINEDKSVDIKGEVKIDMVKYVKVAMEMSGTSMTEEEIKAYLKDQGEDTDINDVIDEKDMQELKDAGYEVQLNEDKENYIYTMNISKHIASIDNISSTEESTVKFQDMLEKNSVIFTKTPNNTYKAEIINDTNEENPEISSEQMKEYMTYVYEVNLPNKAISHNATSTSNNDKTLTWDIMTSDTINFEFAFPEKNATNSKSNNKILTISLIAGGGIGLLAIAVIYCINKKKKSND